MSKITEFETQRAFCLWAAGYPDKHGKPTRTPAIYPGIVWWHTPNGGSRRDCFEGKRLKDIGVKAGIPDMFFLNQGALFGLEFKALGEMQSASQREMEPRLLAAGLCRYAVVDSLMVAKAQVIAWNLALNC